MNYETIKETIQKLGSGDLDVFSDGKLKWTPVPLFQHNIEKFEGFDITKDVPEGFRLPTKDECEELCKNHPFYLKTLSDEEEKFYAHTLDSRNAYVLRNDLGMEITTREIFDDWSGFMYSPFVYLEETRQEVLKKRTDESLKFFSYSEICYDIANKKFYEHIDWRVSRTLILIKIDNKNKD